MGRWFRQAAEIKALRAKIRELECAVYGSEFDGEYARSENARLQRRLAAPQHLVDMCRAVDAAVAASDRVLEMAPYPLDVAARKALAGHLAQMAKDMVEQAMRPMPKSSAPDNCSSTESSPAP